MNVITALKFYLNKIFTDIKGVKVLLLDDDTKDMVSVVQSVTEVHAAQVYLIDYITNKKREAIKEVKCVMLLRPTMKNIQLIKEELANPKYPEYHLCKRYP
jgi:vacuolar protein sorting-associated protein 45